MGGEMPDEQETTAETEQQAIPGMEQQVITEMTAAFPGLAGWASCPDMHFDDCVLWLEAVIPESGDTFSVSFYPFSECDPEDAGWCVLGPFFGSDQQRSVPTLAEAIQRAQDLLRADLVIRRSWLPAGDGNAK